MKSKFGTALALTAVLLTGTAAAAINTQALISPTESPLGTAATTLLPPIDMVAVGTPAPTPGATALTLSNDTSTSQPGTDSIDPNPATNGSQPMATPSSSTASPKPVYGNPNPSNGEDDDEDDDGEENDDDGDDD